jgi:hypothetical protein
MALSAQQVEQYQHDGYVCPVPVMPSAEALGLRRQIEAVEAAPGRQARGRAAQPGVPVVQVAG